MKFTKEEEHDLTNFVLGQVVIEDDVSPGGRGRLALFTKAIVRTLIRQIEEIRPEGGVESFVRKLPPGYSVIMQIPFGGQPSVSIYTNKKSFSGQGSDLLSAMEIAAMKVLQESTNDQTN